MRQPNPLTVRLNPTIVQQIRLAAESSDSTRNGWVVSAIQEKLEREAAQQQTAA